MTKATLILIRHGESEYNQQNRFAGWVDTKLTPKGIAQAHAAGETLKKIGFRPDVVYVSTLSRAIDTASEMLAAMGLPNVALTQRPALRERHYGGLTGMDKKQAEAEFGPELFLKYRRSYDTPPPPMRPEHPYHPENPAKSDKVTALPENGKGTEALADVVARVTPFWEKELLPLLQQGKNVLISAHGNSLRALSMIIEHMTPEQVTKYEMANAEPVLYAIESAPGRAGWEVSQKRTNFRIVD